MFVVYEFACLCDYSDMYVSKVYRYTQGQI